MLRVPAAILLSALSLATAVVGLSSASAADGPEFVDVEPGGYYADAVDWLIDTGLTTGTSPTTFSPDLPVTRGQAAVFLWRHRGEPTTLPHSFIDVDAGAYHHDAVGWLAGAGITTGTSATTFGPDEPLTRGQAATLLWRALGEPEGSAVVPFVDVDPSRFYASAVEWMVVEQITTGTTSTTFSPDAPVTRAQFATFLWRFDAGEGGRFAPVRSLFSPTMNSEIGVDGSGRVLISGSALTSTPAPTALYSPDGEIVWSLPGDRRESAVIDEDGSIAVFGSSDSAEFGPHAGGVDGFLQVFDPGGGLRWETQFGTAGAEGVRAAAFVDDGEVLVAGWTDGDLHAVGAGDRDVFVRRYDAAGALRWGVQFGSPGDERVADIVVDDTGFFVVGSTEGALGGEEHFGESDVFVRRHHADGSVHWTRQVGHPQDGSLDSWDDFAKEAVLGSEGELYTLESRWHADVGLYYSDHTVRRWDVAGVEEWRMVLAGASQFVDSIVPAADGGVIVGASLETFDPYRLSSSLVRYDGSGVMRSRVGVDSPDDISLVDLAVTHDGGVLGLFSLYEVDGERAVYEVRRFG